MTADEQMIKVGGVDLCVQSIGVDGDLTTDAGACSTRCRAVGRTSSDCRGGGIAQFLAIDHPDRMTTLTLMPTAPIASVGRELPGIPKELLAYESTPRPEPDWGDRSAVIAHVWTIYARTPGRGRLPSRS